MEKDLTVLKPKLGERKELADTFLGSLCEESRLAYRADLTDFARFVGLDSVKAVSEWLVRQAQGDANYVVLAYQNSLRERELAAATMNRRIAAIRSMIAFANTIGAVSWKLDIGNVRHEIYRDVSGIAPEAFQLLLDAAGSQENAAKSVRDVAILLLLHDLGLRRKEVVGLDYPPDIDVEGAKIWILGKGRAQKETLSVPSSTLSALVEWIQVRGQWEGATFVSFRKSAMTRRALSKRGLSHLVEQLGAMIGIKLHPHQLRHTAINTAVEIATANNIPIDEVLQYSRHRQIQTLLIYRDKQKNMQGEIASLVSESRKNGKR